MRTLENLRPFDDRVLVKQDEAPTEQGGIILTEQTRERLRPATGTVVLVGPGKKDLNGKLIPMNTKVGDHVYFGKYAGNTIEVNDGDFYLLMRETDLFMADDNA